VGNRKGINYMIGKIKGIVKEIENNSVLIETNSGIFFQVFVTARKLANLSANYPIEIYTYLYVSDENISLYGFENKEEYNLFKILIGISGIGPKTAFSIISFTKVEELIKAVKENNVNYFNQIPGLGRKTSLKVLLELSSKLKSDFEINNLYLSEDDKTVIDALVSLGFKSGEIKKIIGKIPKNLSVEEKIKEALKMIK
jgi:Holliday junction DNA helicase RuvA